MPASRYDPDDALVSETPAGYRDPDTFRYPFLTVFPVSVVLLVLAAVVFGVLLWNAQGPAVLTHVFEFQPSDGGFTFSLGLSTVGVAFVASFVLTGVLPEGTHGLVSRLKGYDVSYGVALGYGALSAAAFHQFQHREDVLPVIAAPLVVANLLFLPFLFVPIPLVGFTAFLGLLLNTGGAAGDVIAYYHVRRLPAGSLLYGSDLRHSYEFRPEN